MCSGIQNVANTMRIVRQIRSIATFTERYII